MGMDVPSLHELLEGVQSGRVSVSEAEHRLRDLPFADLGDTLLDHHREIRTGMPEVVYAEGKTSAQVATILARLAQHSAVAIATRASSEMYATVRATLPTAIYYEHARIIAIGRAAQLDVTKYLVVASAGTSDMPVAEEAAITAELLGHRVERLYDVGVAGLHRLLAQRDLLFGASAVIVVAGMEGALASVVGGLVAVPVLAVPTSVGYGTSLGGIAALLSMLNSCAPGVAVLNIDNGFGAAAFAHLVLRRPVH
ncbi:MAG: nickel pincer cofactor biosynthesis protein LarB [Herpetosiphon sp.]